MLLQKMIFLIKWLAAILLLIVITDIAYAQSAMVNPKSRKCQSLNREWKAILDPTDIGEWREVWLEKTPQNKTDFYEYSFEGGSVLNVPGDFNSQMCELTYYEGTIWYKKDFNYSIQRGKRVFLHFGAVNYRADVYLNGKKTGSHEGGFTPFEFEITSLVKNGKNTVVVKVNNNRIGNGLPGHGYDWFNYGGITRDVDIIEVENCYIEDYCIQLKKGSIDTVQGWVLLNGNHGRKDIKIKIPELNLNFKTRSDDKGFAKVEFSTTFELWSPEKPKLYKVLIQSEGVTLTDEIGFRSIEVKGSKILLNKKTIFIKSVNIHEENPYKGSRAHSLEDAKLLLNSAKELGCNLVRLSHYPHSENMVKEAEKMGLMVWSELPIYQYIRFADSTVPKKMELMLNEMVRRDRNRCGVVIWSLSNETYPTTPNRDNALIELTNKAKKIDSTRLITHVVNTQGYTNNTVNLWDPLYRHSDILSINEYLGWYVPWQGNPADTKWDIAFADKPVLISEFGGEALYGSNGGRPIDRAAYWTEEYQEKIYRDQIEMFNTVPNLAGVCPWILYDYRSLGRMHPTYQNGYNRKGLLSEKGQKKKAWYIIKDYFMKK